LVALRGFAKVTLDITNQQIEALSAIIMGRLNGMTDDQRPFRWNRFYGYRNFAD